MSEAALLLKVSLGWLLGSVGLTAVLPRGTLRDVCLPEWGEVVQAARGGWLCGICERSTFHGELPQLAAMRGCTTGV